MGRHKERVKQLVSYVVQQELVQPRVVRQRVAEIQIPALERLVRVVQLPHVERLRYLIIYVLAQPANADHLLRVLRELRYQHVYHQLVQPQHQLTHLLLAR